jgi:hypothetical protein
MDRESGSYDRDSRAARDIVDSSGHTSNNNLLPYSISTSNRAALEAPSR